MEASEEPYESSETFETEIFSTISPATMATEKINDAMPDSMKNLEEIIIDSSSSPSSSIESPYQLLDPNRDIYYESTFYGFQFPEKRKKSLLALGAVESPYYLLEDKYRYPEIYSCLAVPRFDQTLEEYESYIRRTVRRLVEKPWKVNIANFKICMNDVNMNSINPEEFWDVKRIARKLVDSILGRAVEVVNQHMKDSNRDELYEPVMAIAKQENHFYWPQMNHFDPVNMKLFILSYIRTWAMDYSYKYFIEYISSKMTDTSEFHYYQVMFSRPLISYPNPQATASVFFTVEVTRVVNQRIPVHVTYRFENYTQHHVPDGRVRFQNYLINSIIKYKLMVFTELDF